MTELLCSLVVGLLCFDSPIESTPEYSPSGRVLITTTAGYVADVQPMLVMPDWRKLPEACSENLCFRYFKHCPAVPVGIVCEYKIGRFGEIWEGGPFDLKITAISQEAMAQADLAISVLSDPKSRSLRVPLNRFRSASVDRDVPLCPEAEKPCTP
jgi:hypothetical protein